MKTRLIPKKSTFQKKKKKNYRAKNTANHQNTLRKNHREKIFLPNLMSNGSKVKKIKSNAKIMIRKKLISSCSRKWLPTWIKTGKIMAK
jgi:ribosomal protein S19